MTCVVASDRPWNLDLADRVSRATGESMVLIDSAADLVRGKLAPLAPRYVFVPHWSSRIPRDVYESFECVVFHMTDLPYGRGGSPLQNLILRGHKDTVISAFRCVEALDAGPVYLKRPLSLEGRAEEIFQRADRVIESMIREIIERRIEPQPQRGEAVVFQRRRPQDGDLALAKTLQEAFDRIRMLDAPGYPHAFVRAGGLRLEFSRAALLSGRLEAAVTITLRAEDEDV